MTTKDTDEPFGQLTTYDTCILVGDTGTMRHQDTPYTHRIEDTCILQDTVHARTLTRTSGYVRVRVRVREGLGLAGKNGPVLAARDWQR